MHRRFPLLLLAVLLTAGFSHAQTLTVGPSYMAGYDGFQHTFDYTQLGSVRTAIDIGNPATATGNITHVKVYWREAPCTNVMKIKFFHRNGSKLTMFAERGPFSAQTNDSDLTMVPAVHVEQGDLIGVARVADCGNVTVAFGATHRSDGFVEYSGDVSGEVDIAKGLSSTNLLTLTGLGDASESVRSVVPVAGSAAGSFNSNFKTSMQLFYGASVAGGSTSGRLVFHPAGVAGKSTDPSLPFTVSANRVLSIPDVAAAVKQTGLGSIDVVVAAGQTAPIVITRAFNDGGAIGTTGLNEAAIDLQSSGGQVIAFGQPAYLVTPADPSKTRFNIGVRTLFSGATIEFVLLDSNGDALPGVVSKVYPQQFFEQFEASTFLGRPISASQPILIRVVSGSAIVYGSTTDNISQDPSVQFAVEGAGSQ